MTIDELVNGKRIPHWVSAVASVVALMLGIVGAWSQVRDTFPEWFEETDYYTEYARHFNETPIEQIFTDERIGPIKVAWYASDGCFLITTPGRQPHWLTRSELPILIDPPAGALRVLPPAMAGMVAAQNGRCLNPHQPPIERQWLGDERRDARGIRWVEVWREFTDGCVHYQLRREDGYWDSHPDGSPRVTWVRCVH